MTPEEKQLLEKTTKLSEENYHMLRSLQSGARWGRFWGLFKWAVIIVPLIFGYFYLQPYIDSIMSMYSQVMEQSNQLKNIQGQLPDLSGLLDKIPGIPGR
ncbi:MAG: hypothetical protein AAB597_03290 [Patescibacteria group bacterium]